jgi:hypothetical protein
MDVAGISPSGECMSLAVARYSLRERGSKDSMALETNMQPQPEQIPWRLLRQLRQPIRIWPSARRIHLIRRTYAELVLRPLIPLVRLLFLLFLYLQTFAFVPLIQDRGTHRILCNFLPTLARK